MYSLDLVDGLDLRVTNITAVQLVRFPIEATLEGVAEAVRTNLR